MKFRKKPVVIDATQFFAADKSTHTHVCYGWPKEQAMTYEAVAE